MKLLPTIFFLFICVSGIAQSVVFTYDKSGNRITKQIEGTIPNTSAISGDSIVSRNDQKTYSVKPTSDSRYKWEIVNGAIQSGANSNMIQVIWNGSDTIGIVKVTEKSKDSCDGQPVLLAVRISAITSIPNIPPGQFSYRITPNPSAGKFTLSYELAESGRTSIKIISLNGHPMYERAPEFKVSGSHQLAIDCLNCNSGIYLVVLTVDHRRSVLKLVLIK
jgi:hypothetical protein